MDTATSEPLSTKSLLAAIEALKATAGQPITIEPDVLHVSWTVREWVIAHKQPPVTGDPSRDYYMRLIWEDAHGVGPHSAR